MKQIAPARHDLVLVGGGHSHALVVRMLAMAPITGTRITLVSPDTLTPYSGMLPGLIAGHYSVEETHIDLARLCQWASVRFIQAAVTAVDTERNRLSLSDGELLDFDWLSIDVGSTPELDATPGARDFAVPVKPVSSLRHRWHDWLEQLSGNDQPHIAVVGAGAGGVEMMLAIATATTRRGIRSQLSLIIGDQLLPGYPAQARKKMSAQLEQAGVELIAGRVTEVCEAELKLDNQTLACDRVLWCTGATGHDFLRQSKLQTNADGFIEVDSTLRSVSHHHIFAAGDCAHFVAKPLPKAGVYAVRQGALLANNLRAAITGHALRPYRPQRKFLSLLSAGNQYAVGNRGAFTVSGNWVWRWKDRIDRKFMARFEQLPERQMPAAEDSDPRCAGCGAKVGNSALQNALIHLNPVRHPDIVSGLDEREDASSIQWPAGKLLVQSHDYFPAFIDEPLLFGRIAAIHSLSDVYAVNAQPHSALATVTLPINHQVLQSRDLKRLMTGAVQELDKANCALLGGHTIEGPQLAAGFTINAASVKENAFHKAGAREGDCLILTKPLGSGILLAAHMLSRCPGPWLDNALNQMLEHNLLAANIFARHQVRACTDITGFGLLGHLLEMCDAGHVAASLEAEAVPTLDGVLGLASSGIHSSLKPGNDGALAACAIAPRLTSHPIMAALTDPQTSGGLLAAVPAEQASSCLAKLRAGFIPAALIGIIESRRGQSTITIE